MRELAHTQGSDLHGLVLDLRGSSGGLLGAGTRVAGMFLAGGTVAYTEGPTPEARLRFEASDQDILQGAPLAVLVDAATASTAELVAGALQDRGRALVFGTPSLGKGTMQTLFLVQCRIVLSLTTARYHLPSGRWVGDQGVRPDFLVTRSRPAGSGRRPEVLDTPGDQPGISTAPTCAAQSLAADPVLGCALEVLGRLIASG